MPGRDGTGPMGSGPAGRGRRSAQGRMGGNAAGPGGYCICPKCGEKIPHAAGTPCSSSVCPKCHSVMVRG